MFLQELRSRSPVLAKTAKLSKLSVISTAPIPQGLNGTMIFGIDKKTQRTSIYPAFTLLIESCRMARKAIKKYEVMDSQRQTQFGT